MRKPRLTDKDRRLVAKAMRTVRSQRGPLTTAEARHMGKQSAQLRRLSRMGNIDWPAQETVSLAEAAELIPYKELAIRRMIHTGELAAVENSWGNIRISVAELQRWCKEQLRVAQIILNPEQLQESIAQLTKRLGL